MTNSERKSFEQFLDYYDIMCQSHRSEFLHWDEIMPINTLENFAASITKGMYYMKQFYVDVDTVDEMGYTANPREVDIEFLAQANPRAFLTAKDLF